MEEMENLKKQKKGEAKSKKRWKKREIMKRNEKREQRGTKEKTKPGEVGAPPKFEPLVQYC